MISVLLVDDHAYFLKSLRHLLESTEDIQVVETASTGAEAIGKAAYHSPDVVVMDVSMPFIDGLEATRQILARSPLTRIMVLSILDSPEYVQHAIEIGAVGYVLKDRVDQDLLAAIRSLHAGKPYFSQQIAHIAQKQMDQKLDDRGGR